MQNIFKTTYRNFVRKPDTNLINLAGLAISLALVIILAVYSYSELITDNFHINRDRVFLFSDQNNLPRTYTPGVLKEQIDSTITGVESTLRIAGTWEAPVFQAEGKEPITSDLVFADESFFTFFTYKVVEGDLESAMKDPMNLIITSGLSQKIFGRASAIGKTLKMNNDKLLTIKAVVEEPETNSALSFSALTSMSTRKIVMPNEAEFKAWPFCLFQTFVLLKDGINPDKTAKSISALFPKEMIRAVSAGRLTPLKDIYFSGIQLFNGNYLHSGDQHRVMILLLVAVLVLLVALVNFINISSSQWLGKIRQTGVMKVIGASRAAIFGNIMAEVFLFFLVSLFLAILLITLFVPYISSYTGIQFRQQLLLTPAFLSISIVGTFFLSLLFSLIPAIRISSSKTIDNLQRVVAPQSKNPNFRGILVAAQFTIAIILIAFTVLVQKQVNFGSSNLGINQKNVIGIKLTPELNAKKEVLKKLLLEKPVVGKISFSQYYPEQPLSYWETPLKGAGEKKILKYDTFNADAGFLETMGLELKMGRFYSADLSTDANKVVVNESFLRENSLSDPIGAQFFSMNGTVCEIVGVVKDFHYKPISKPILPLAIRNEQFATHCLISLSTNDYNLLHNSMQDIKRITTDLSPSFPVEVGFLDLAIENLYRSELQFRRTFSLLAGCAIIICCLGILAVSLFTCQLRIKEIGIRKINGAKVTEVLSLLNKDFVKWVAMAFVIATPIAYYAMHKWLENFAYKTELSWWIFAMAGLLALGIALLTVSWQSWKAATRNPVEALRYE